MKSSLILVFAALCSIALAQRGRERERERERTDRTIPDCFGKIADVFFVLDSSSSIYVEDYRQVLDFVSQVVTRFDVSRDDTRIGSLTFSDDFQLGYDLDRFRSKAEVLASTDERTLPYRTGVTNTDLAIRYVRESRNFRQDITKVMVVITDGGSRNQGQTMREADLAREAGFHMVVVGVGQYLDEQEWRAIASDPNNDYLFNITNFNFLGSIVDQLPRRICNMPPIIIGGDCGVSQDADILFLAAPNGLNDALDIMESLQGDFRNRERLQVRYIMEACETGVDSGFEGPDRYCNRFGDAGPAPDENTYVNLVTQLREAATSMRADRNPNQIAVLFMDDLSMQNNRYGILQEVRNIDQFDNLKVVVVDLGVREYKNFVIGMADRGNVIDYATLSPRQGSQDILDRICVAANSGDPFGTIDAN